MQHAVFSLNFLAVIVSTIAGFVLGWLWYSPVLFAKPWMAEMKITPEAMKAAAEKGMAVYFTKSLVYTLLSTFGLAVLIAAHGSSGALAGAKLGAFVGLFVVGARLVNGGTWEQRSARLLAINVGHEVVLFALQGAILAAWR
jgi:hypothetical protein